MGSFPRVNLYGVSHLVIVHYNAIKNEFVSMHSVRFFLLSLTDINIEWILWQNYNVYALDFLSDMPMVCPLRERTACNFDFETRISKLQTVKSLVVWREKCSQLMISHCQTFKIFDEKCSQLKPSNCPTPTNFDVKSLPK